MKGYFLIICFIFSGSLFVKAQNSSCSDLIEYVKHEGQEKEALQSWQFQPKAGILSLASPHQPFVKAWIAL